MKKYVLGIIFTGALYWGIGCSAIQTESDAGPPQTFRGKLMVMVADDFKTGTARTLYRLISDEDGAKLHLRFRNAAPPTQALRSGTRVEIQGTHQNDNLIVKNLRILE